MCWRLRRTAPAPVIVAPVAPAVPAAPAPAVVNAYSVGTVFHSGGSFRNLGGGRWQELDGAGRPTFSFTETGRDEWSVYLIDQSRGMELQLDLFRRQVLWNLFGQPRQPLYVITNYF